MKQLPAGGQPEIDSMACSLKGAQKHQGAVLGTHGALMKSNPE
ncbi:hypothetical protein [Hoeflea sp.]